MSNKVLFVADVHFGIGNRLNDILWAMRSVSMYALENDIKHIFVLGDLFHDRNKITVDVGCAAYEFFENAKNLGQEWIIFPGNHDMFMKSGWNITSVKTLSSVARIFSDVTLLKIGTQRFWLLPFIYFEDVYMKVLDKIHQQYEAGDVLLTHVGANNASLNECFLIKHWSIVDFTDSLFDRIYGGHFHCHQQVGKNMWFVGSPIPFKFDEGVVDHGFIEFDMATRDHKFINIFEYSKIPNPPPDFPTITDEWIDTIDDEIVVGNNIRVVLSREYSSVELAVIRDKLIKMGAKKVSWMKAKEEEIELKDQTNDASVSISDASSLIKMWLSKDKPEHINSEYLLELNDEVVAIGNDKISVDEEVWE